MPSIETSKSIRIPIHRYVAEFIVSALSFWFIAWILPGISIHDWGTAFLAAGLLSILNAMIWPVVARYFSRALLWTAGLLVLFLNGALLMAVDELLDGLVVDGWWAAIFASLFMTAATIILSSVLSLDDDAVFQRKTMRRMVDRLEPPTPTDVPGVLFLQIDGLAEPVLRRAIAAGTVPTLARWVRGGTHQIAGWECDLSSQTGASQAGILHGNNENMPAFRWYDKDLGKVLTSNRPRDAAIIEHRQSDGHGLLVDGGVSRSNVFSGDSKDSILTFSTVTDRSKHSKHTTNYVLSDPYAVSRLLALTVADVVREMIDRRNTRRLKIEPSLKRGGIYPVLRAATTTILRDLTLYTLMSDVYRGVPAAYADFVGYDEVAHHSGIFAKTAMDTLGRLDQQLGRLEQAIGEAPAPVPRRGALRPRAVPGSDLPPALRRDPRAGRVVVDRRAPRHRGPPDGVGGLGQPQRCPHRGRQRQVQSHRQVGRRPRAQPHRRRRRGPRARLPRRSQGPLHRAARSGRCRRTGVGQPRPHLVHQDRRTRHVRDARHALSRADRRTGRASWESASCSCTPSSLGPLAIGGTGIRYLVDDRVEGEDPLAAFGPNCADHLRRTSSFVNAPDILVNSFFDPHADEGAAFEELIGFHGGLGGEQSMPFILHPSVFPMPDGPIVGAATVHHLFKGWLAGVHDGELGAPWTLPAEAPNAPLPQIAS